MSKSNIEILLSEWGAWKRPENRGALGYPNQAAFQSMRVDGQRRTDPSVLLVDDDIRRIDDLVGKLYPEAMMVATAHYVWSGPVKLKLSRVRLSRTGYYDVLDFVHKQLSHQMGGKYVIPATIPETILSGHLA